MATRETPFAKEAFNLYLQLPKPRSLKDLAGQRIKSGNGGASRPLVQSTLEQWLKRYHWRERADQWDDEVLALERQKIIDWRLKLARQREMQRLDAADLQRQVALSYLVTPDDEDIPEEQRGKPRPMQELDPQYLTIADRYLRTAADTERADLGSTVKQADDQQDSKQGPVLVLTEEGVNQLRDMVDTIKASQPKTLSNPDIVDAEFEATSL